MAKMPNDPHLRYVIKEALQGAQRGIERRMVAEQFAAMYAVSWKTIYRIGMEPFSALYRGKRRSDVNGHSNPQESERVLSSQ